MIKNDVKKIMSEVFNLEKTKIKDNTDFSDIAEWDSLSHLNLVLSLEKEFNIRFETHVINNLTSLKEIINQIEKKKNKE